MTCGVVLMIVLGAMERVERLEPGGDRCGIDPCRFELRDVGGRDVALGGVGIYRLRQGKNATGLLNVTTLISLVLIVGYVVAVWAMTGKPN